MTQPAELPAVDPTMNQSSPGQRPTRVRYVMIFISTVLAVLLYLHRISVSTAVSSMAQDLDLTSAQKDSVLSAFFWTYALAQIPAGWLGDRFGARWMLGAYLILWSLSTGLMGLTSSLTGILILRHSCGLFQAGAYPVAAGVVRRWVPIQSRGIASSMVAVGGRLGGVLAPILTIQLMLLWTYGTDWWNIENAARASITSWRPVMMIYGATGVGLGLVLMWFFRDWPQEHPGVNAAELALIQSGDVPLKTNAAVSLDWPPIIPMAKSKALWMVSFVQFASNFGWAFLITKLPQYLEEVFSTTQQNQAWVSSLPLAAGICGMFLGGALTDRLTQRFGLRWGRAIAMGASRFMVALSFLALLIVDSSMGAAMCMITLGLSTDLGTPACWAFGQDVGGRHVGSVFGWSNMWGNIGAALSPLFFGMLVASAGTGANGWNYAFIAAAVVNLAAAAASFGINASKPLQA